MLKQTEPTEMQLQRRTDTSTRTAKKSQRSQKRAAKTRVVVEAGVANVATTRNALAVAHAPAPRRTNEEVDHANATNTAAATRVHALAAAAADDVARAASHARELDRRVTADRIGRVHVRHARDRTETRRVRGVPDRERRPNVRSRLSSRLKREIFVPCFACSCPIGFVRVI